MSIELIRGPFILHETVDMLFKYVNGVSFRALLSPRRAGANSAAGSASMRRLEQLEEILEECCRGLDPHDPALQRFFAWVDTEDQNEDVCLARLMTGTFCTLQYTDFDAHLEQIRCMWRQIQDKGGWIQDHCLGGLSFSFGEGSPGDLLEQICALRLPADFQLQMYRTFRDFDRSLSELADLIRPIARELERVIAGANWIMEEMEAYWSCAPMTPLDFLAEAVGPEVVEHAGDRTLMAISLMNCNVVLHNMAHLPFNLTGYNYIYMGCDITLESLPISQESDYENVSAILKALGDKKRLEILNRLARSRSYCHELADTMGTDPGNMSRNLTMLYNCGFLRQKRDAQKNYYETDPEALRDFFRRVELLVLP